MIFVCFFSFFFSSRRRHTRLQGDWSSDCALPIWGEILPKYGGQYRDAKLVLFRDYVQSGCGTGQSAMGPFYCPLDEKVYVDLGFYDALRSEERRVGKEGRPRGARRLVGQEKRMVS